MATRELPDWGVDPVVYPVSKKLALVALLAGPVLLFLLGLAVLQGTWDLGFLALTVGWLAFLVVNQWRAAKRTVLQGKTLTPANDARFENLVRGLASQHGLPMPELLVIEEGGPNAVVLTRPPRLAVTRSLLETFTRTELEAVAAHGLLRLRSSSSGIVQLAAALGRSGSRFAPRVGYEDDVLAAALTRYPPALASAIAKSKPVEGSGGPFWFVAHDASHRHPTERIAALRDL